MALSEIDRNLLRRCLEQKPGAWEDFVDRFMGLVVHVINHAAHTRAMRLSDPDREDLCAEVFMAIVRDDFAVLRHFRGQSSLATYLTVVVRRVVVRQLLDRKTVARLNDAEYPPSDASSEDFEQRIADKDEIEKLLGQLGGNEAEVVRMYHLEGKTYQEISSAVGVSENSVGPILSRAREKLRKVGQTS